MLDDLFNNKNSSIFEVFNERFRNKSLLFKDLEIISDQLVELTEALNTTRDDILCADNLGAEISRSLNFSTDTAEREKYEKSAIYGESAWHLVANNLLESPPVLEQLLLSTSWGKSHCHHPMKSLKAVRINGHHLSCPRYLQTVALKAVSSFPHK